MTTPPPKAETETPTPRTDVEHKKQQADYESQRETGWPPFPADFDFARKLERELQRAMSLVRLCRGELHEQNAITDKEYADILQQSDLRTVLETHDDLRAENADLSARLTGALEALREMENAINSKILGKQPYTYILEQFPATEGHVPLRDWFAALWWRANRERPLLADAPSGEREGVRASEPREGQ